MSVVQESGNVQRVDAQSIDDNGERDPFDVRFDTQSALRIRAWLSDILDRVSDKDFRRIRSTITRQHHFCDGRVGQSVIVDYAGKLDDLQLLVTCVTYQGGFNGDGGPLGDVRLSVGDREVVTSFGGEDYANINGLLQELVEILERPPRVAKREDLWAE